MYRDFKVLCKASQVPWVAVNVKNTYLGSGTWGTLSGFVTTTQSEPGGRWKWSVWLGTTICANFVQKVFLHPLFSFFHTQSSIPLVSVVYISFQHLFQHLVIPTPTTRRTIYIPCSSYAFIRKCINPPKKTLWETLNLHAYVIKSHWLFLSRRRI